MKQLSWQVFRCLFWIFGAAFCDLSLLVECQIWLSSPIFTMSALPCEGSVIEVFWTEDREWYPAKVLAVNEDDKCATVMYEDENELFVHSLDEADADLCVQWRAVTDELVVADLELKYQSVLRCNPRSKLGRQIRNTLQSAGSRSSPRSNTRSSRAETDRTSQQGSSQAAKGEGGAAATAAVAGAATTPTPSSDSSSTSSNNNNSTSGSEADSSPDNNEDDGDGGMTTPRAQSQRASLVTLPSASDSDSSPAVSPTLFLSQIEATQHLSPAVKKIHQRRQEHSQVLTQRLMQSPLKKAPQFDKESSPPLQAEQKQTSASAEPVVEEEEKGSVEKQTVSGSVEESESSPSHVPNAFDEEPGGTVTAAAAATDSAESTVPQQDDSNDVTPTVTQPRQRSISSTGAGSISPETAQLHNMLLFRSPKKRRHPRPPHTGSSSSTSPYKKRTAKDSDSTSAVFVPFLSPLRPRKVNHSFSKLQRQHEAAAESEFLAAAAAADAATTVPKPGARTLKHQKPIDVSAATGNFGMGAAEDDLHSDVASANVRPRARSASFDSYYANPPVRTVPYNSPVKGRRPPVYESMLPLRHDPSGASSRSSAAGKEFVSIPASRSPFKKPRALTDSQRDHKTEAVDNYKLFPSLKLAHLAVNTDDMGDDSSAHSAVGESQSPSTIGGLGDSTSGDGLFSRSASGTGPALKTPRTEQFRDRLLNL